MKIAVIADTHIPTRANGLPEKLAQALKEADLILHAGDFVEMEVLRMLQNLNKLEAVFGNMDEDEVKKTLTAKKIIEVEKVRIGIVHGCDICWNLNYRVPACFDDEKLDCVVYGHTHIARNEIIEKRLYFNPGSPTDTVFVASTTFGILKIEDKKIESEIVEL